MPAPDADTPPATKATYPSSTPSTEYNTTWDSHESPDGGSPSHGTSPEKYSHDTSPKASRHNTTAFFPTYNKAHRATMQIFLILLALRIVVPLIAIAGAGIKELYKKPPRPRPLPRRKRPMTRDQQFENYFRTGNENYLFDPYYPFPPQ